MKASLYRLLQYFSSNLRWAIIPPYSSELYIFAVLPNDFTAKYGVDT